MHTHSSYLQFHSYGLGIASSYATKMLLLVAFWARSQTPKPHGNVSVIVAIASSAYGELNKLWGTSGASCKIYSLAL